MDDGTRTGIANKIAKINKRNFFFAYFYKARFAMKTEVKNRIFATKRFGFPTVYRIFKFGFGVAPVMHKRHIAVLAHQFENGSNRYKISVIAIPKAFQAKHTLGFISHLE
jgi:hypothetical protein